MSLFDVLKPVKNSGFERFRTQMTGGYQKTSKYLSSVVEEDGAMTENKERWKRLYSTFLYNTGAYALQIKGNIFVKMNYVWRKSVEE